MKTYKNKRSLFALFLFIAAVLLCCLFGSCKKESATSPTISSIHTIKGSVIDPDSIGIEGISASLSGNGKSIAVGTDSTGCFTFTDILDGVYTVVFNGRGYTFTPSLLMVTVEGGDVVTDPIIAEPMEGVYSVSGIVIDKYSVGIEDVLVTIANNSVVRSVKTLEDGSFKFNIVDRGTYTLTVQKTGNVFCDNDTALTVENEHVVVPEITVCN